MDSYDIICLISSKCDPSTALTLLSITKNIHLENIKKRGRLKRRLRYEYARDKITNHVASLKQRIFSVGDMTFCSYYTIIKKEYSVVVMRSNMFDLLITMSHLHWMGYVDNTNYWVMIGCLKGVERMKYLYSNVWLAPYQISSCTMNMTQENIQHAINIIDSKEPSMLKRLLVWLGFQ